MNFITPAGDKAPTALHVLFFTAIYMESPGRISYLKVLVVHPLKEWNSSNIWEQP